MKNNVEWIVFGWLTGLVLIFWSIVEIFKKKGLWLEDGSFFFLPIILFLLGVVIIVFTMVVADIERDW